MGLELRLQQASADSLAARQHCRGLLAEANSFTSMHTLLLVLYFIATYSRNHMLLSSSAAHSAQGIREHYFPDEPALVSCQQIENMLLSI